MKISVIIPCYNEEAFIGQAIGSVIEQSLPANEIIVVDDGSTDRSAEIAGYFGKPVKVLQGLGEGAPKARNFGAEHAAGEAYMFLDADDVLGPKALESLAACLEQNSSGVVACPWYRLQKIDERWVQRPRTCEPLGAHQDKLSGWLTGWWHPPCSVLWSRTGYERTGGWDPNVTVNQDGDLIMRALVEGTDLQVTNKGAAYYRRLPEEQMTNSLSSKRFTRKGRKSQIYVLKKIAIKLAERDLLDNYRKPLTKAFDKIRLLCQDPYPELAKECLELIEEYGEPRHIRIVRKISDELRHAANLSMTYSARTLTNLGFTRTREILAQIKNKLSLLSANGGYKVPSRPHHEKEKEIRFGLEAYLKVLAEYGIKDLT